MQTEELKPPTVLSDQEEKADDEGEPVLIKLDAIVTRSKFKILQY